MVHRTLKCVSASEFKPKTTASGTCDPYATEWTEHTFHFVSQCWGLVVQWERPLNEATPRFTFPLIVRNVKKGSEAEEQGLKVGDHIVAVCHKDSAFIKVQEAFETTDKNETRAFNGASMKRSLTTLTKQAEASTHMGKTFVEVETANILVEGGRCRLKVLRQQRERCPNCGGQDLDEDTRSGDTVCMGCGVVLRERLMMPCFEGRVFEDARDDPRRTGPVEDPLVLSQAGMATTMQAPPAATNRNAPAARLCAAGRRAANADRQRRAETAVDELCDEMGLPTMMAQAARRLVTRAEEEARARGGRGQRAGAGLACAAVMMACEEQRAGRTLKEMLATVATGGVSRRQIIAARKRLQQLPGVRAPPTVQPADLIPRFCSNLGAPAAVERLAVELAERARARGGLEGRVPASVAAAAILEAWGAEGSPASVLEVSEATGVAAGTIALVRATLRKAGGGAGV